MRPVSKAQIEVLRENARFSFTRPDKYLTISFLILLFELLNALLIFRQDDLPAYYGEEPSWKKTESSKKLENSAK